MRILAALVIAVATVLSVAGCKHADGSVPASVSPWAACPHGDAGRVKDVTLTFPAQWVCVR
jgi:hypothetical protein